MLNQQDLETAGCNKSQYFHSPKVVGRGSKTQLQVSEYVDCMTLRVEG